MFQELVTQLIDQGVSENQALALANSTEQDQYLSDDEIDAIAEEIAVEELAAQEALGL